MKSMIPVLLACSLLMSVAPLRGDGKLLVEIDEHGARPRTYRLSCRDTCGGYLIPHIIQYRRILRRHSRFVRLNDTSIGVQDGRFVLTKNSERHGRIIIGDGSNLDDIRLLPGVSLRVSRVHDAGLVGNIIFGGDGAACRRQEWTLGPEYSVTPFTGARVNPLNITLGLIDAIENGHEDNELVLSTALRARWGSFLYEAGREDNCELPADHLERMRFSYTVPMQEAHARFDSAQRRRLMEHHREVVDKGRLYLDEALEEHANSPQSRLLPPVIEYLESDSLFTVR